MDNTLSYSIRQRYCGNYVGKWSVKVICGVSITFFILVSETAIHATEHFMSFIWNFVDWTRKNLRPHLICKFFLVC